MADTFDLGIKLSRLQKTFMNCSATEILYGGCLSPDTLVITEKGTRRIDSINIGDLVLSPGGNLVKVIDIPFIGKEHSYKLSFGNGYSVIASAGHKWSVSSGDGFEIKRTIDLLDSGSYVVPLFNTDSNNCDTVSIISIEYIGITDVTCITVDSEDHLFVLDTGVITSNSLGGGKTFSTAAKALVLALKYPGIHVALFRRTLGDLKRTLLLEAKSIYPERLYHYRESDRMITLINGSVISFNYVENDADLLQYKSVNHDVQIIDEAVDFTEYQLTFLKTRLRTTIPGFKTKFYLLTNPIGRSHEYLKKRYIDGKEPFKIYPTDETKHLTINKQRTQCYIPARLLDNPVLMENDPEYIYSLRELPEDEFLALLLGEWNIQSGLFFRKWTPELHIEKENYQPTILDNIYLTCDWGSNKPSAVLWIAVDQFGTEHIYRELYTMKYNKPDQGTHISCVELAKLIKEMTPEIERPKIKYMTLDNACWSVDPNYEYSIYELMQTELRNFTNIMKSTKDRISGWAVTGEHLELNPSTEKPILQVSPCCEHFIRTFPTLLKDDKKDGDLDTDMEDHIADAYRYFCMCRPRPRYIPLIDTLPHNSPAYFEALMAIAKKNYKGFI